MKEKNSANERQDAFFRKMTADEKVLLGSRLWRLAHDLVGNKITYASRGSPRTSRQRGESS